MFQYNPVGRADHVSNCFKEYKAVSFSHCTAFTLQFQNSVQTLRTKYKFLTILTIYFDKNNSWQTINEGQVGIKTTSFRTSPDKIL